MTVLAIEKRRTRAWWKELWVQVLIAMAIGIALGIVHPDLAARMQPLGDAFIKAIRMLIAPILFCTVVHGIAHMADMARVGRVAIKAIVYFEIMTTVALVIGLIAVNLLKPGVGMNIDPATINAGAVEPYVKQTAAVGFVPFLMNIIPGTFVGAFAEGNILQVLFISVVCGFALVQLGDRAKPLVDTIDIGAKMIFAVVAIVMWAAPIGAFGGIAFTVGKFGVGSLASLGKLLAGFYLTCVIFVVVALGPVARLCGISLMKLIRYIWEELLICIATTSSETVLPRMITKLEDLGCEESVVGLVIPTGYSFNLGGGNGVTVCGPRFSQPRYSPDHLKRECLSHENRPCDLSPSRRLRLARRRCDRAARQARLSDEDCLFVLWRARRKPIRLESGRRDACLRQGWPQG